MLPLALISPSTVRAFVGVSIPIPTLGFVALPLTYKSVPEPPEEETWRLPESWVSLNDISPLRAINSFDIFFLFLYPKDNNFILYFYKARREVLTVQVPAVAVNFNLAKALDKSIVNTASDESPISGVE